MDRRLHRRARVAAGTAAGLMLLLPMAACSSDNVDCSGKTCTVKLEGNGAKASILGNDLALADTKDGKATLSVGDASVSCTEGQSVTAGPLSITCTSITDKSVELTAKIG